MTYGHVLQRVTNHDGRYNTVYSSSENSKKKMFKALRISLHLLLVIILATKPAITSYEDKQNKEVNKDVNTDGKLKILEEKIKSELLKISDSILNMKTEVARLIDFNNSIQIMHDAHDRNYKDILSVSEWLDSFTKESNEKVKYIYSILQNLTDYKIILEYDMEKIKPLVEKVVDSEEQLKTLVKRIDITSKTLTHIQERLDKLSEEHNKESKDDKDFQPELEKIKQKLQSLYDKTPEMEKKIEKWEENVISKKDVMEQLKRQSEQLEESIKTKKEADSEIQELNSRVNDLGNQLSKLKETLGQVNKDGDNSKISTEILTSIRLDFENNLKKLEITVKDAVKNIYDNKINTDRFGTSLDKLTKQIDSEKEKSNIIDKEFKDLKKKLGSIENKLNTKLVTDLALQSNHFQTFISSEVGQQDAKLTIVEKKLTKKLTKVDETIVSTLKSLEENKEDLKTLTSNHESNKLDIHKMITNLQTDIEFFSNGISVSQQQIEILKHTLSQVEGNTLRFDLAVSLFACLGIGEFVLIIVMLKSKSATERPTTTRKNRKTNQNTKKYSYDDDNTICTVSFNTKGKKQHQRATESLLQDSNFSLDPPVLVSTESDIQDITSSVVLAFIDTNDKVDGNDALKWKTVQSIEKMGGNAFVVIFGDSGSKQLAEDEVVNSKLLRNKQFEWKSLVSKERLYSVFKEFNEFQKEQLLTEFAELL